MYLRIAGSLCIIAATSLFGICSAKSLKYRIEDLAAAERGLTLLKSEMGYSLRSLPEALAEAASRQNGVIGAFFAEAGDRMRRGEDGSAGDLWAEAAKTVLPSSYLNGEDVDVLLAFGQTLGLRDQQQQAAAAEFAVLSLREHRAAAAQVYEKQARLHRSLGLLSGVLLSVLLL